MIKVPISYMDFDGKKLSEEHYFHLSKSELIDMETGAGESMSARLERVGRSGDGGQIMRLFREIIAAAYGQRVDGSGSQFYKDPELTKRFLSSLAFDQLLEDLILNTTNAIEFVNGIMPAGLNELAAKVGQNAVTEVPLPGQVTPANLEAAQQLSGLENPFDPGGEILAWAYREPTEKELMKMNEFQMKDVFRRKGSGWKPPVAVTA